MIVENNIVAAPRSAWSKVSWGAVVAAVVLMLALQLFFSALGLSFGAGSVDATEQQNPLSGLGKGAMIWLAATTLLSLLAGGWVAGRLSGATHKIESALHGLLGWAVTTLITFYLLSTATAGIVRGTTGVVGRVFSTVASGVQSIDPSIARDGARALGVDRIDLSQIENEAERVLRQTRKPELNPKRLNRQAKAVENDAEATATDAIQNPQEAGQQVRALIQRTFGTAEGPAEAVDTEALVNVLMARTDMSRAQAESTVKQWQETAQQLRTQWQKAKVEAEAKTRAAADQLAHAVSRASWIAALVLLLGALSASIGGLLGRREPALV